MATTRHVAGRVIARQLRKWAIDGTWQRTFTALLAQAAAQLGRSTV